MNSTEKLASALKKKFNKFLNMSSELPNTSMNRKNVSWTNYHEYDSYSEEKKPFRSTPYPNPSKKMKISNSTPKTLSFDESDSDCEENSYTNIEDISKLCNPKIQGTKRKRNHNVWTVTSCNEIKPDKTNKSCNLQNETNSSESNADFENESNEEDYFDETAQCEQIVVRKKLAQIQFDISSSDDELSDSNIEQIFKPKIQSLDKCRIIETKAKLPVDSLTEEQNSSDSSLTENLESSYESTGRSEPKTTVKKMKKLKQKITKTKLPFDSLTEKQNSSDSSLTENLDSSYESNGRSEPETTVKKIENLKQKIRESESKNIKTVVACVKQKIAKTETKKNFKPVKKPKLRFSQEVQILIKDPYCLLFLKHPVKFYFSGKLSLTVLCGAVEILGHVLTCDKKEFDIYSPRGNSYLSIETVESNIKRKEPLENILESYGTSTKQLKSYLYGFNNNDCIIAIKTLNNNLTNYLSSHVAQYLFPKPIQCKKKIEKKLHCLFELSDPKWRVYKKNEKWAKHVETTLNNLSNGFSCTLLCGGKSVGKSTLFRYMINSLLNNVEKVVCIDLDPGQSEFTIGGCISVTIIDKPIFGPNFTHLTTPVKSIFVGDVNVVECIDRYISSVKELLTFCQKNISQNYPWVVNSMGFTMSIVSDLTISTIKLVNPTMVLQINSSMKYKNYPAPLTADYVQNHIYSFPIIIPQTKLNYELGSLSSLAEENIEGEFKYEARHLREMSILSYFSQIIEIGKEITSVTPYSVKMSSLKLHDLQYSKENIPPVLNGNLVALCKTNAETIDNQTVFDCVGFGVVRGIDLDSGELYLITPVPEIELESVNSLIRGNINLPPSLYMTTGRQGLVPYISLRIQQKTSNAPKRSYKNFKSLLNKK